MNFQSSTFNLQLTEGESMAYMEVLLNEDIDNLGHRGQVVRVRAGYGRNYLLPQGLAIEATVGNKRMIEEHRRVLAKREDREKNAAHQQGQKLDGVVLSFDRRVGEHGILYGSVTAMDIAAALAELGQKVERRKIGLHEPIKEIGEFEVRIKLHRDVTPSIKVVVRKVGTEEPALAAGSESQQAAESAAPEVAINEAPDEEPTED
jgi:large subunit ribosomal protein L9